MNNLIGPLNPTRLGIAGVSVAIAMFAETSAPADLTSLGRDLAVAGVLFYFYRQIASDFKTIVQENTRALTALKDSVDKKTVQCPLVDDKLAAALHKE